MLVATLAVIQRAREHWQGNVLYSGNRQFRLRVEVCNTAVSAMKSALAEGLLNQVRRTAVARGCSALSYYSGVGIGLVSIRYGIRYGYTVTGNRPVRRSRASFTVMDRRRRTTL
jgi:hypothetical protein